MSTPARARVAWKRHRRALLWLSGSSQLEAVLSVLLTVILIRALGITEAGAVLLAMAISATYFSVVDPRFEDSLQRYVPMVDRDQPASVRDLVRRLLLIDALVGVSFGGIAIVAVLLWPTVISEVPALWVALALAAGAFSAVQGTAGACFAVTDGLHILGRLRILLAVVVAIASVLALLIIGPGGFLAAGAVGQGIGSWFLTATALRRVEARWSGVQRASWRPGFGRFTALSSAATSAALGTESAIVSVTGLLAGPAAAAGLKIAIAPGRMLFTLFSPLWAVVFPMLTRAAAKGQAERLRTIILECALAVALAVTLLSTPLILVMRPLLGLIYGADVDHFAFAATVLVIAYAFRATVGWSKVLPLAIGRPGLRLAITSVEAAVVIVGVVAAVAGAAHSSTAAVEGVAWILFLTGVGLTGFWLWVAVRVTQWTQ